VSKTRINAREEEVGKKTVKVILKPLRRCGECMPGILIAQGVSVLFVGELSGMGHIKKLSNGHP